MSASRYVHVHVDEILKITEKAFLMEIDGEEVWIPFSQMADPDDLEVGDADIEVAVTEWLAHEKGLETLE